jgi:thioesterase domain-containing protein
MKKLEKLINRLHNLGINLYIENGQLKAKGPKGTLSKEIYNEIKTNKEEILKSFNNSDLIRMIQDKALGSWSPLVRIQSNGKNAPFFCVHPGLGSILCYTELAHQMGSDQPFYGLQASGLDQNTPSFDRFQDMASKYLETIRTVSPKGPYLIGGFSTGGMIAYEMAQQLRNQGGQPIYLFLIDTFAPHMFSPLDDFQIFIAFNQNLAGLYNSNFISSYYKILGIDEDKGVEDALKTLQDLSHNERLKVLWKSIKNTMDMSRDLDIEYLDRTFNVFKGICHAIQSYSVPTYKGPVFFFRATDDHSEERKNHALGWDRYVLNPIRVYDTPGNHFTMLRHPNVRTLAIKLKNCLNHITSQCL